MRKSLRDCVVVYEKVLGFCEEDFACVCVLERTCSMFASVCGTEIMVMF